MKMTFTSFSDDGGFIIRHFSSKAELNNWLVSKRFAITPFTARKAYVRPSTRSQACECTLLDYLKREKLANLIW